MRKHIARSALTVLAGCAAAGLTLTSGTATAADGTWSISPGGSFTSTAAGTPTFTVERSGQKFTCDYSSFEGSFKSGTNLPSTGLGRAIAYFENCNIAGIDFSRADQVSLDGAGSSGSQVGFYLKGVEQGVAGQCKFTYQPGSWHVGFYDNNTDVMRLHNTATVETASCYGIIKAGDKLTSVNDYKLQPAQFISKTS
ncbi:hypothetical protein G5C51_19090 [Streptomyces sp. A7024]|uniref:Secreted protein n=1 Tax=Streptomyces coryli TaxID=1128680 RepID=A0A6G4U150_9ACTN|nr:hypothetical protein [Streptomyces coryli]NGN65989.1 hypothetical protein [Streptomyces coryli]